MITLQRFPLLAASLLLVPVCTAATLRVPQDYTLIQRALIAAAPGDTVQIDAGEFREQLIVPKALTLQGAGPGKTVLIAPDRNEPVVSLYSDDGTVVVRDLTLKHGPAVPLPPPKEGQDAPSEPTGAGISGGRCDATLINVIIESVAGSAISFAEKTFVVKDVVVREAGREAVHFYGTQPATSVSGLSIAGARSGTALQITNGAGTFSKLTIAEGAEVPICVQGVSATPVFKDLPAQLREKISWKEDAHPDGIEAAKKARLKRLTEEAAANGDPAPDPETLDYVEQPDGYSLAREADRSTHQRENEPTRRELARSLQASLRPAKTAEEQVGVLREYVEKLLATFHPGESADIGVWLAIRGELRGLFNQFGGDAVMVAHTKWPENTDISYFSYDDFTPPDIARTIQQAKEALWYEKNGSRLEEVLASWKEETSADPAMKAEAFARTIRAVDELLLDTQKGPENLRDELRKRLLLQVGPFVDTAGYPALAAVIKELAGNTSSIVTGNDIQDSLNPEQKRQLIRALRGIK